MNRTRLIFFLVIAVAVVIVGAGLVIRAVGNKPTTPVVSNKPLEVRVVTALAVEPWVTEAAKGYNASNPKLEGQPIHVTIIPMDGLSALSRYDSASFEQLPTAWIPDSRYLVELANAAQKDKQGRDVFLTDGEYRAKPIALSLFAWGIYQSRAVVLEKKFGEVNWKTLHDAATAKGGWPELGGDPQWGFFQARRAESTQERGRIGGHGRGRRRVLRPARHQHRRCDGPQVPGVAQGTDGRGDRLEWG